MTKNTSGQKIGAQMVSASDGSAFTGSVTVYVTGDAGTQGAGSVGSGACTHEGNGYHTYAPAQAETNYDLVAFTFIGTGAIPQTVQVETSATLVTAVWAAVVDSSGVTTLLSRLSSARAGYLDNLSAGAVALASTFTGITSLAQWLGALAGKQAVNSTAQTEIRATGGGSGTYDGTTDSLEAVRDNTGTAGAALTAVGDTSGTTTLLSRLSSARAGYLDNLSAGAVALAATFSGITSLAQWLGLLAGKQTGNSTARTEVRATGAGSGTYDETTDSQEATRDNMGTAQTGDAYARLGAPAGASVSADVAAVKTDTGNLATRITSTLFSGITSLAEWLGQMAGKQTPNSTAQTEIRATGAGSGTFDATVDSHQALRDRGDAAWTTATGFSTHSAADAATAVWAAGARTLTSISGLGIALATKLTKYIQLLARKDSAIATDNATEVTELNADGGSGAGAFANTTDALEAVRDRGDAAWVTGSAPTASAVADAVWEEAIADHSGTSGSVAEALNAAGSAGDPWTTALPGSYSSGQAGKIIGDNLNATISSRASQTSVDDLPTNAELATALAAADDAVLAAIAALNNLSQANIRTAVGLGSANLDTQLDALPTNAELATALAAADDAVLAAIAALNNLSAAQVKTQADQALTDAALATAANLAIAKTAIDAVKAKTDSLTFTVAGQVDANVQRINDVALVGDGSATPWGPA